MPLRLQASQVAGQVADFSTASGIVGARVTLFSTDLRFFRETRTTGSGDFRFEAIGDGVYRLGVAALSYEYQETTVSVTSLVVAELRATTGNQRWSLDHRGQHRAGTARRQRLRKSSAQR